MQRRLKVIQWATGSVGRESLKAILMHPELELAGVWVHSAEKAGRDAGELCGMPPTGIEATDRLEEILACEADCVAYMPRLTDIDELCALLASGKNVICTPFLFYGQHLPEVDRKRVSEACEAGRSSVHGTGIHPGFVGMVLPLALSGMSRTIDHIRIEERADWTFYDSPRITFDNMRFGHSAEEASLDANPFARFNADIFEQQIRMLSDALGAEVDEIVVEQDLTLAPESVDVRAGRLEKGTVSGQRYHWIGRRGGVALIEIDALWTLGGFYPSAWPRPKDGWTVSIEGDPSMRSHFMSLASFERRDATMDEHVHASDTATAMQAVNSIPALCAALPGMRGTFELEPVRAGIGFRR
ncbi:MAG: dihydrodipicolinate reductase [Myxococcota bacterium]